MILVFLILNPEVKISGVMLSSPLINPDKIRNFYIISQIQPHNRIKDLEDRH